MEIKIVKLYEGARIPERAHPTDAAYDLYAAKNEVVKPYCQAKVPTGIAMQIPQGWYGDIRPRSSMFSKGYDVSGVIDSGYRGEIMVILQNNSEKPCYIAKGERIAQMILLQHGSVDFIEVDALDGSDRGTGGFGSTGK